MYIVDLEAWLGHCARCAKSRFRFRVAFGSETLEEGRVRNLHTLMLEMRAAVAAGAYNFLPCPPLVFSSYAIEVRWFHNPGDVFVWA